MVPCPAGPDTRYNSGAFILPRCHCQWSAHGDRLADGNNCRGTASKTFFVRSAVSRIKTKGTCKYLEYLHVDKDVLE